MTDVGTRPNTDELRAEIERALCERFRRPGRVVTITRRSSAYHTTSPIEELTVALDDGECLRLMLKDLSRRALSPTARRAKPRFLHDPMREIETYRTLLAPEGIGAAFFGAGADRRRGRYWLLVERIAGVELYQVGDLEVWCGVARWLARLHERFRTEARPVSRRVRLLRYDADFYRLWLERALGFARGAPRRKRALEHIAERYDEVIERLVALPATVIHGEFYASNVLVADQGSTLRVYPVDWEMAAIGPGLVDLAALTSGWRATERASLTDAYRRELARLGDAPEQDRLAEELVCCRLHLAVQWLGWSRSWKPPLEHRQDWLQAAVSAAEELHS